MSLNSKSLRRYGHVPPVQYEQTNGSELHYTQTGLQRQQSFDNNDDVGLQGYTDRRYETGSNMATGRSLNSHDQFMESPYIASSHGSLDLGQTGHIPLASPHYQQPQLQQYLPFSNDDQLPSHIKMPSIPHCYSENEPGQNMIQSSLNPNITSDQGFNSSIYQITNPSRDYMLQRNELTNNSYPEKYNNPATLDPMMSSDHWQQNISCYTSHPGPLKTSQNDHLEFNPTTTVSTPISPRRQDIRNTPSFIIPYGLDDNQYEQTNCQSQENNWLPSYEQDSYSRSHANSYQSPYKNDSSPSTGCTPDNSAPLHAGGIELQRHPTSRPLPNAPVDEVDDTYYWGMKGSFEEVVTQKQLYEDIGDALGAFGSRQRIRPPMQSEEPFDAEMNVLQQFDLSTINDEEKFTQNICQTQSDVLDDRDDNASDVEAEAGLEGMRLAEEQDLLCGIGGLSFGQYERPRSPQQFLLDDSSDENNEVVDLGSAGGGYDAHLSYGGKDLTRHTFSLDCTKGTPNLQLPIQQASTGSGNHISMSPSCRGSISEVSNNTMSPFPAFDDSGVDIYGENGLQMSNTKPHRMSFDEGDEQMALYPQPNAALEGENPSRDDTTEYFYYPNIALSLSEKQRGLERPLPPVPETKEDRGNPLAGIYHDPSHDISLFASNLGSATSVRKEPNDALSIPSFRGGQYFSRSSSLSNHGSAPYTLPPARSKTDAEERQARQRIARMSMRSVGELDGYDIGSPQSLHALDLPSLPANRQKKFCPTRLSSADFNKCKEPWALSSIATWIIDVAGGGSIDGEADLRIKAIEDGIVALFTHKMPTMNTADAETLSQKVADSLLETGILVREEEWVKFGQGEISGILWQLTGSGCYSPKLHEYEMHGRCYSHHCARTLKKINLQAHTLEPCRKTEDWITFFKLTKEQLEGASKKEIQRQNNLHEIVMSEDLYMDQINILRILYRDELSSWQPPIIVKEKLPKFIGAVFGKVQAIKAVNESYLLAQLKYRQKEQGPWIVGFSDIFREWIRKAKAVYIEYAAGFPQATHLVRKEAGRNLLFRQFLDQARDNKLSGRLDWNTYLKAPITRLQRYSLLLGTVLHNMTQDSEEKTNLAIAIEEIKAVTLECDAKVDEQSKKVEMLELRSKLNLRPGMDGVELNLDHIGRKLIFEGDLQRAGTNRFNWLETHAILLDNYLILAKTISKGDFNFDGRKVAYDVSKHPIPMQLLVLESTNDDPVVKSSVKGIASVTTMGKPTSSTTLNSGLGRSNLEGVERTTTLEHTLSNQSNSSAHRAQPSLGDGDARQMYPFRVKHLGKPEVYTLYAPSAQNRMEWCDRILDAKTQHTISLHEQNAEPFRLRVIADSAFALDNLSIIPQKSSVSVCDTPLDRAIRELENIYGAGPRPGPVCRAQINCATVFTGHGKAMVAIGTDYGVYISEESNPRGWTRQSIQISRVTQISVLEEFSLCLIIAEKALIAYPLEVVVPASGFPAPAQESVRRAPQKLSGSRDVSFFATSRMKDRTLLFYKKREGLHSTFKVLEPVFQKSSEKRARLLGKLKGGTTEFFRAFDEFYIPTECFTINIFHSYIAISTLKGFELMTLDKKVPMSIPDTKDPAINNITARLAGQKPLGMFRLSSTEFLLCYEECGVYVNKHGDVSRSVIMEFVGKAKTAVMYGTYLVLFDSDFVEVRNAENGRLRQVIAGRDIRCLDYAVNPLGAGVEQNTVMVRMPDVKRTLKFSMIHPEVPGIQLVLEMILNEGHSE
ncbi:unnamed protein product [Blumeria hordei]|uniref:Rho1 guanine nucleotide exchange factor 3 n=1 Tax=Blumeria hordei TaxID=2867405 RepID=A0A383UUT8_BLUHO|nr:unnamed protein product [Blumeria hordei]